MRSILLLTLFSIIVVSSISIASAVTLDDKAKINKLQADIDNLIDSLIVMQNEQAELNYEMYLLNGEISTLEDVISNKRASIELIKNIEPHTSIEVRYGEGYPGCEETPEGCFIPSIAIVNVDGKVIFKNNDSVPHALTSGIQGTKQSGAVFDSILLMVGAWYEWYPTESGEVPYYCIIHPWQTGSIIVID